MKPLILSGNKALIERELLNLKPVRRTRRGNNLIYIFKAFEAPHLFREVARFREMTYRDRGGGTGKALDEDDYDLRKNPYHQVIIWNEQFEEIVGGFRYGLGEEGNFATENLYFFSKDYLTHNHHHTLDIGRMFIQSKYQFQGSGTEGVFSLDNIWDGFGAVLSTHSEIKFLLGRIVSFRSEASIEQMIADFFVMSFFTEEKILSPKKSLFSKVINKELFELGHASYNYKVLIKEAKKKGVLITPLIFAYMNVAKTLNYMGTVLDSDLNVLESCIMVKSADIYPYFKKRYFLKN